jgi:hypothetical protein
VRDPVSVMQNDRQNHGFVYLNLAYFFHCWRRAERSVLVRGFVEYFITW